MVVWVFVLTAGYIKLYAQTKTYYKKDKN
jgi:hypothetical protein